MDISDDINQLSPRELNGLKRKVELRLRSLEARDSLSLAENLAGKGYIDLVAAAVKQSGIRGRSGDRRIIIGFHFQRSSGVGED